MGFLKDTFNKAKSLVKKVASNPLVNAAVGFIPGGNVVKMVSAVATAGAVDKKEVKKTLEKFDQPTDAKTVETVSKSIQAQVEQKTGKVVPIVQNIDKPVALSEQPTTTNKTMEKVKEFWEKNKTVIIAVTVIGAIIGIGIYIYKRKRR